MKKLEHMMTYWSIHPTDGVEPAEPAVIPYADSLMALPPRGLGHYAGWRWLGWEKGRFIYGLLDLCADTYVDHVTVRMHLEENMQCDYQRVILSARTADDPRYKVTARFLKQDETEEMTKTRDVVMELKVNATVRCLNLEFTRGEWWHLPVPQIEVFGEEPTEALPPFSAEQMATEWKNEAMVMDKFGQATYIDYPGKITCEADLRRDAACEWETLKNVKRDETKYDRYGGLKTGKNYGATGFFRVQKVDGIWWFITPEGNLFFLKGVDGITYDEMSHYTPIYQKDTTVVRGAFEELPDKETLPQAYKMHDGRIPCIDFQEGNLRLKYGEDYKNVWADVTMRRLLSWNFNASGKWKLEKELYPLLPRIDCLLCPAGMIHTKSGLDPFDPAFEDKLDRGLKAQLEANKDDPMLIGSHFMNEDGWEMDDLRIILHTTDGSFPAKAAFVDFIKERYQNDLRVANIVLATEAASFEELITTDINMDEIPHKDAVDFVQAASRRFHEILLRVVKRHDPNHLFFGMTPVLNWRACWEWTSAYTDYVDVLAVDWYFSQTADWTRDYLFLDKPMVNIEFGYITCDRGHGPFFSSMTSKDQADRAWRYNRYVSNQAKVPQFIGIGYFIYSDQEIGGRSNGDGSWGECYQFGLVSTQDQPYTEFVKQVTETNAKLEELHMYGAPQE